MTIIKRLCPAGLSNNPNKALKSIDYITIHCTGNRSAGATAKAHADYQYSGSGGNKVSWHYTADDNEIWQSFDDTRECWHAGDGTNGPGNSTSIGIEICVNDKTRFGLACQNAAKLTASLLIKHKLVLDRVVQHNRWSDKDCPAELRSGEWGVDWKMFVNAVEACLYEMSPVVGTHIMGTSVLTAGELAAALLSMNPNPDISCTPEQLARHYIEEGEAEGIRGDIAFFQAVLETGCFSFVNCDVSAWQNNFCGLGATGDGAPGASFDRVDYGVRAQIQHLKAYASTEPLNLKCVDPRFGKVTRGIAPCWEDLNGRWAVPGNGYGERITELFTEALLRFTCTADAKTDVKEMLLDLTAGSVINSPDYWVNKLEDLEYFGGFVRALWEKYESVK